MATPPQNDNMTHSNAPLNFRHTDTLITTKVPHYPTKVTTGMSIIPGWNRPNANGQNANINDKDYVNVVKKVKKDNITPNNINEIMLSQIPGISSTAAIAIMEQFKTIPNLITSIQNDPKCLSNVCFTNTKGQSRKINKTCSTNIVTYLLNTEAKI